MMKSRGLSTVLSVNRSLQAILDDGFSERGGCIVLTRFAPKVFRIDAFEDASAFEWFTNRINIDDWLGPKASADECQAQGVAFALQLAELLEAAYPHVGFEVVMSSGDGGANVGFHRHRDASRGNVHFDDLDLYEESAMMAISVT